MPIVKVNAMNMYYESVGQGEPLVLISGFGADHMAWVSILDQLAQQYRVILFDNRGAGQTDVPAGPYSVEQMADDVAALCTALKIEQAHFIGNSMGGHILQSLAYHHADRVKSLVISNSVLVADVKFRLFAEGQYELFSEGGPALGLIKSILPWLYSSQFLNQPDCIDRLITMMLNNPYPFTVEAYKNQLAALKDFNSSTWAKQIKTPTLVIGSDQDMIFESQRVQALADKIPQAKYYEFKSAGHLPHIEQPQTFVQVVSEFINSIVN